jgi:hypothetical protein
MQSDARQSTNQLAATQMVHCMYSTASLRTLELYTYCSICIVSALSSAVARSTKTPTTLLLNKASMCVQQELCKTVVAHTA